MSFQWILLGRMHTSMMINATAAGLVALDKESRLVVYSDIFDGSKVMDGLPAGLRDGASAPAGSRSAAGAVEAVPVHEGRDGRVGRGRIARSEAGER